MNKKAIFILEIIWIIVGVLSIIAGIRYAVLTGGPKTWIFFCMALVSAAFAWIRHRQRKKS